MKSPLDKTPYPKDPRSVLLSGNLTDGLYVYVQDQNGLIHVLPDGPHVHPKVLGNAEPAKYAGDLTILHGKIADITNLSGTFQFDDEAGLIAVAQQARLQGAAIEVGAARFFPLDGSGAVVLE